MTKEMLLQNHSSSFLNQTVEECECDLFKELHKFRQNIEEGRCGLHHYPYTTNKNRIFLYKSIFFALSGLFAFLAFYLYFSYLSWTFSFFFKEGIQIKQLFFWMCGLFSVISSGVAFSMIPEKELTLCTILKAKKQIKKMYKRRLTAISCVNNSSPFGTDHERAVINHTYEDVMDKIGMLKNETLMTLKRIRISKQLNDSQKEHLYNQALLELQFKLEMISNAYGKNDFGNL